MKTQLLEDIGQSASRTLVPSSRVLNAGPEPTVQVRAASPGKPRSASGVWRQNPAGDLTLPVAPKPEPQPAPVEVPAPAVPEAIITPVEPTFSANAVQWEPALHDPLFDFVLPAAAAPASDLFKPEPSWLERSGLRSRWGAGMLAGVLVVLAGAWYYDKRTDENALALVADRSEAQPQVSKVVKQRVLAAKEFTLGPDGEVMVTPAAPSLAPSLAPPVAATAPALVLLEPDPAPGAQLESTAAPAGRQQEPQVRPKAGRVAELVPTPAQPKRVRRAERAQVVARAPVVRAEKRAEVESPRAAMLKECKAHGYQEAQCVKRACSMTKYGFVCRGK